MRVGFYFELGKDYEGYNLFDINKNNPGFSGTRYMFFLIAHLLAVRDNGIDVTFFLKYNMILADNVHVELTTSFVDVLDKCQLQNIDFLIIKDNANYLKIVKTSRTKIKTKIIVWCHNFVPFGQLTDYAKCKAVERLVCVGREQADVYRDHKAFQKTDWIYNCVTTPNIEITPINNRKPIVTYIGAIIPSKGFHLLARVWPQVIKAIPKAELYVIGNGRLYERVGEFGKWNLAEKNYEDSFMGYLTKNGKLLPGVHLMGILGNEKFDILKITKVGVPNPSGLTETFCISAVEMQLMGASIAAKRCVGYMDTVRNGTLVNSPNQLANCIIKELRSHEDHYEQTRQYIIDNFSQDVVAHQWELLLLEAIPNKKKLHPDLPIIHPDFEMKKWKEKSRRLKTKYPALYSLMPSIGHLYEFWKKVHWAIWKRIYL